MIHSTSITTSAIKLSLVDYYQQVRQLSETICAPLATEDFGIQSMPDVSPPKWHLAHTTWFFETFLLLPNLGGYEVFHPKFGYLFNSYYEAVGQRHPRAQRGLLSRPTVAEVYHYRAYVDEAMRSLLAQSLEPAVEALIHLGLHHEQQHQELLLTDIKHILALNPLRPAYRTDLPAIATTPIQPKEQWLDYPGGLYAVGSSGAELAADFAFDNEGPQHPVYLQDYYLASRLITNGEYLEFMQAGGYSKPEYWLAEGWSTVQTQQWQAPLYWEKMDGQWWVMTLAGLKPINEHEPVCHVSYYEADAYATWAGKRLPTESEWEVAAAQLPVQGNLLETGYLHPIPAARMTRPDQMFGDVWEWTQSAYSPYPGFKPAAGAVGEYNGKFMCNQMVLRGGSCVTPPNHIRSTYRNFFPASTRWQLSGIRLAQLSSDVSLLAVSSRSAIAPPSTTPKVKLYDLHPPLDDFRAEVLYGLSQPQKSIPPKFLYDKQGAELFDAICTLEEYYLTRAEISILQTYATEIAELIQEGALIEFGSGSSQKIRILFDVMTQLPTYVALDISKQHLQESCEKLVDAYPGLDAIAICTDYTQPLQLPEISALHNKHRVGFFPGSSIGNLEPDDVIQFLRHTATLLGKNGSLLVGVDLKKNKEVLELAYDDSRGISADFALNILNRMNRELGADFDIRQFQYRASYNPSGRIEMGLISLIDQVIHMGEVEISFDKNEMLHTENSYKYSIEEFQALALKAGFEPRKVWLDAQQLFSVHYLQAIS